MQGGWIKITPFPSRKETPGKPHILQTDRVDIDGSRCLNRGSFQSVVLLHTLRMAVLGCREEEYNCSRIDIVLESGHEARIARKSNQYKAF